MTQRTRIHSDRLLPVDPSTATTTNCPRRISAPANLERLQLSALSRRPQDPPLRLRALAGGTWRQSRAPAYRAPRSASAEDQPIAYALDSSPYACGVIPACCVFATRP